MGKKDKYANKKKAAVAAAGGGDADATTQPAGQQPQPQSGNPGQLRPQQNLGQGNEPGTSQKVGDGQSPPQAAWGPQSSQSTGPPKGAVPKAQPKSAPTSSQQAREPSQVPRASMSALSLTTQPATRKQNEEKLSLALKVIESSPDGRVYEGKRGRPVKLEANYLAIDVEKLVEKAYHYDVTFDPNVPKKMLPTALNTFMRAHFPQYHFAFDGRCNFYTAKLLEKDGKVLSESEEAYEQMVTAVMGDRSKEFKVKVKFATEVDMSILRNFWQPKNQRDVKPSQAIQCLDVILRTAFKSLVEQRRAVNAGRALYFAPTGRPNDLGEGMELWLGLFQSAILGRQSLYLNVDVAHKAFPSAISVLDVLTSFDRNGQVPPVLDQRVEHQLNEYLRMLTIEYQPTKKDVPKTYGYNGLVWDENRRAQGADRALFVTNEQRMTVEQYFRDVKGIKLQFPKLPVLHVGSRTRNIYLPLELCRIPAGQATNRKVTPNCVAKMIKFSATSTDERKRKIEDLLSRIDYASNNGEIRGFGINVDTNFQNIEGRVIKPPSIKYKNGGVDPNKGVWRGQNFIETQPKKIQWAIINCDGNTESPAINKLSGIILNQAKRQGMQLASFNIENDCFNISSPQQLEQRFAELSKNGYGLVFVIIVDRNDCYAKVKQAAELRVGILTQCIKSGTVSRMVDPKKNPQMTIANIMLKVNAKLGGKNHEVDETSYNNAVNTFNAANSGVMFVGADVTHPSPDARDIPSVVGVAASHDQVGFRYNCAWRLQNPKEEVIQDLENILAEQLNLYKQKNGNRLPGKLMYYRDGVSDGQFGQVLDVELAAIRRALQRHYGPDTNKHAKVTFIVIQKRHHTRFFPTGKDSSDGGRNNNNVPAGTVVDKDIVHPFQYQFFMASHAAIQGVTKPAKYCVLVNESKIDPDDLQAITYDLCHLFTRCNRSVSYPAPTYYAHLVAARGKVYTVGQLIDLMNLQREFANKRFAPNFVQQCPMFFV